MIDLMEQIKAIATDRFVVQQLRTGIKVAEEELQQTEEYKVVQELRQRLIGRQEALGDRETTLRAYAVQAYEQDHPLPEPLKIRIYTILEYDEGDAFDYCLDAMRGALKLDKRKFEKAVKALNEDIPGVVTILKQARATIATDLSEYVEEVE